MGVYIQYLVMLEVSLNKTADSYGGVFHYSTNYCNVIYIEAFRKI